MSSYETELSQYEQAKQEAIDGENAATDDYYRIPAIMQDCKTAYNLSWNGSGAWEGNTFVRTASMPNINGTITFKATISIARKPKYFLWIKIHRAIVQISWTLTTEYSDTQVVEVVNLDPSKSDAEKPTRSIQNYQKWPESFRIALLLWNMPKAVLLKQMILVIPIICSGQATDLK